MNRVDYLTVRIRQLRRLWPAGFAQRLARLELGEVLPAQLRRRIPLRLELVVDILVHEARRRRRS